MEVQGEKTQGDKNPKTRILVAIFAVSLLSQSTSSISLILQGVLETYPEGTVALVQMMVSAASIISMFGMLVAGAAATLTTKKNLLVLCLLLITASGLIGYFATPNLIMMYVACSINGIGVGGLVPLLSALIAEHFKGTTMATVMGTQSIFANGGAIIIQLTGGFLAAIFWKNLFFIWMCALLFAVVALILLPKGRIDKRKKGEKVKIFSRYLGILMFSGFFVGVSIMVFLTNNTMYLFELGIGNEAQAGFVTSAYSIGAMVCGILIALMMRLFRRFIFAVSIACSAIGLWVFTLTDTLAFFIIGAAFIGAGFSLHSTAFMVLAPANTKPAAMTMTMSIFTGCVLSGAFISPFVITPISRLFSDSLSMNYLIAAIAVTVVAGVAFLMPSLLKDYKLTLEGTSKNPLHDD